MADKFISKRNLRFLLHDVFDVGSLTGHEFYSGHTAKSFDMTLDEALRLAKELFWSSLEEMDQHPPELVDGRVRVHPAVPKIMAACGEGGWIGAAFCTEHGGDQLPLMISSACRYIFAAANYSASVYPELTAGAAHLIISFGAPHLLETYLPHLLSGAWQGTMALTEPQAGSSLADITTTAEPRNGGYYLIQGQKIFISAGDHDGAENIVHLMLAKIPGGPPGVKGISLFVVPKYRVEAGGKLVGNDITVSQVYHKLGYRGTPLTELILGEKGQCRGYLVGEPHKGLGYMFQMMNEARIGVGLGATAIASAAYYAALDYARLRCQGRKLGQKDAALPPVPIIDHADVRRMLLFQRAVVEGSLALILQCCQYADFSRFLNGQEKQDCNLLLDLLTPIAKSYPSEMGVLSVSQSLQCFGGYGYCQDFPVEQYYRDARIHPIHEGTTGIHGLDLLGRKIVMQEGRAFFLFLREVEKTVAATVADDVLTPYARKLTQASDTLQKVTRHLVQLAQTGGPEIFLADATLYLELFGIITIAWQWLLQAAAVRRALQQRKLSGAESNFYQGKLFTFRYFFLYELPKIQGLAARLMEADPITVELDSNYFID
jgi:alkylation response protein AidB-like acyl-CoA dehydrogenase